MSYKASAKNRRLKRTLHALLGFFRSGGGSSTPAHKVVIFGSILTFVGLSVCWVQTDQGECIGNGYKSIFGIGGYITCLCTLLLVFLCLNEKQKEYLKAVMSLQLKDGYLLVFLSIICLILTVNGVFIVESMSFVKQSLFYGKGLVISIVGSILCLGGSVAVIRQRTETGVFIDDEGAIQSHIVTQTIHSENNMKLPF